MSEFGDGGSSRRVNQHCLRNIPMKTPVGREIYGPQAQKRVDLET